MKYRTFSAIAVLINELTFFYNAFLLFSFVKTNTFMSIDYLPWACGGTAILLWNRRFLQKERTLLSIIAVNTVITCLWLFLGIQYFFRVQGITAYGFACVLLISTTVRAVYLSCHEISDRYMLTYTEICIIGTGLFFFIQAGPFILPMSYIIPSLAVVFINILAVINTRLFSEEANGMDISSLRGGLFLAASIGIISVGIVVILSFISAPFRALIIQATSAVKNFIIQIFMFISWLFSLLDGIFKPKKYDGDISKDFKIKIPEIKERRALNKELIKYLPWLLILLVSAMLIYLIIKHRKKVLRRFSISGTLAKQKPIRRTFKLWSNFKSIIKSMYRKIQFYLLFINKKHTPQGIFLTIERWGKRKGLPRKSYETPGAYLQRLMNSDAWKGSISESNVDRLVQLLIKELEWRFYTKGSGFNHTSLISKDELKSLEPFFQRI